MKASFSKRYYSPDFSPGRVELVTLNQLIKFINRCCEYIFVNTVEDIYKEFAEKIKKVITIVGSLRVSKFIFSWIRLKTSKS